MIDVLIAGRGPAGISAAVYAARAGLSVTAVGSAAGSLALAKVIENYYGFDEPISGAELQARGERQARLFGVEIIEAQVTGIEYDGTYTVDTTSGQYSAKAVILAVGRPKRRPRIEGLEKYVGSGVSYCAVCDGFFYRNKRLGVLGSGEYALGEARRLSPFTKDITIYTDGLEPEFSSEEFAVEKRRVMSVFGDGKLNGLRLDGEDVSLDGLFVAVGEATALDFAAKLGAATQDGVITVDSGMHTSVPRLYAAGDCTGGLAQVSTAVGQGALAGQSVADELREGGGK